MRSVLAGVAAFALVLGNAALADPGGKGGGGKGGGGGGGGGGQAEHAQGGGPGKGGGHGKGGGKPDNAGRGDAGARGPSADRGPADRGQAKRAEREVRQAFRGERGRRKSPEARAGRGDRRGKDVRGFADETRGRFAGRDDRVVRVVEERRGRDRSGLDDGRSRLIDGCPPGLAKKNNGCMPPGQLKQRGGWWSALDRPAWWGLGGLAAGSYFYEDGYLVRYEGDEVDGWLPLLGGALAPGNVWPSYYEAVPVPDYYQDYYGLGPSYRYYDDVLYRVDPETSAISSVAALLTGDDFAVGEPLPAGYDVYNVPYEFRDEYVDGPDSLYRYSDGYVYQVDPETRLIAAAIELLT